MGLAGLLKFKETSKQIVSIDFGASFIKVAFLELRPDKQVLSAYAVKEFNSHQESSEAIAIQIKNILEQNSISVKEAYLSISDPEGVFIKKFILPAMPKDELLDAIKWQFKNEISFNPDDAVSDLQLIREYADSEGAKKVELFGIFASRTTVNKYLQAAVSCGLRVTKISSNAFNYSAILNRLSFSPKISVIFDIGQTHSHIAIYKDNKLNFMRGLNFSVSEIVASLVEIVATDEGKVEISPVKANNLIRQAGIPLDGSAVFEGGIRASQVIPLIRPLLEEITRELTRSFDYFKSENNQTPPQILYLTGGGANLKNLNLFLGGQLKMKSERLPLPDSLITNETESEEFLAYSNQLSSAIGAGLSATGINLLPPEVKSQKIESIQESSLRIGAVVISAIFIFSWAVINFQIRDYKKRLNIAKLHLNSVEEVRLLKQNVDLREELINKIHYKKTPSGGLLKLVGSVIPTNIILNEFDFDEISHLIHLKGTVSAGRDPVEKVLIDFMNSLEKSKFIVDANLISSKDEMGINNFEIECQLNK